MDVTRQYEKNLLPHQRGTAGGIATTADAQRTGALRTLEVALPKSAANPPAESFLERVTSTSVEKVQELGGFLLEMAGQIVSLGNSASSSPAEIEAAKEKFLHFAKQHASTPEEAAKIERRVAALFSEQAAGKLSSGNTLEQIAAEFNISKKQIDAFLQTVSQWEYLPSRVKIERAGSLGIDALQIFGVLSSEQAEDYRSVAQALSILANKDANTRQKALAAAEALANLGTISFEGTVNRPNAIGGVPVIAATVGENGENIYLLEDKTIVPESDLRTSQNVTSALQAVSILTSDLSTKEKILSLTEVGITAAAANDLIDDFSAGNVTAPLSIFNTARNWSEMNDSQRIANTLQTSQVTLNALSKIGGKQIGALLGQYGAKILSGVGALAGIFTGANQALDTIDAVGELPRSQAVKAGAMGLGTAGAMIGAGVATASAVASGAALGATLGSGVPVVGTLIGAAVGALAGAALGAFGSGKSSSQKARDSWRDALEQGNFAEKIDGSHHVPLADGTTYNIGKDGGHKLLNVDGSERKTVEVDWKNPLASENIGASHVFALATGLDPLENDQHWLFLGAATQSLNAATSNATTDAEVMANYRTMLESGGQTVENIAMQIEVLRLTNKITDQTYEVYLSELGNIFEMKISPRPREVMHEAFVQELSSAPELSPGQVELLTLLTDQERYDASVIRLQEKEQKHAEIAASDRAQEEEEAIAA
ncbi:hypothetical protein MRY87_01840 [bacterium]|nr:hypothetical protein [bacterium]